MDTITMHIIMKDFEYGRAFARGLQMQSRYFSVIQEEPCNFNIAQVNEGSLVVCDDDNVEELVKAGCVILTEKKSDAIICEESKIFRIYKYQKVSDIARLLRLAYRIHYGKEVISQETEDTTIISIFAVEGGAGCTSIALGVCQELRRFHGKKVLYISLEEFVSTGDYFLTTLDNLGIKHYLYLLLHKPNEVCITPDGYMTSDEYGVSSFYYPLGRNPLRQLKETEYVRFMNHIVNNSDFTHIVVDCGNGMDHAIQTNLAISSSCGFVCRKLTNEYRKDGYFLLNQNEKRETIFKEPVVIHNFYEEVDTDEFEPITNENNDDCFVFKDYASFETQNNKINILLDRNFGEGIREVTNRLIRNKS